MTVSVEIDAEGFVVAVLLTQVTIGGLWTANLFHDSLLGSGDPLVAPVALVVFAVIHLLIAAVIPAETLDDESAVSAGDDDD